MFPLFEYDPGEFKTREMCEGTVSEKVWYLDVSEEFKTRRMFEQVVKKILGV